MRHAVIWAIPVLWCEICSVAIHCCHRNLVVTVQKVLYWNNVYNPARSAPWSTYVHFNVWATKTYINRFMILYKLLLWPYVRGGRRGQSRRGRQWVTESHRDWKRGCVRQPGKEGGNHSLVLVVKGAQLHPAFSSVEGKSTHIWSTPLHLYNIH